MKRASLFVATAAAAMAVAGAAAAQDWSGFYVGAQAGYGWGDVDQPYGNVGGPFAFSQDDAEVDGGLLGGHAGINWQNGSWVFGIEGDIEWTSFEGDDAGSGGDVNGVEVEWQGSLRGRLGYSFTPNVMGYVTAGWQMMDVTATAPAETDDETVGGWVWGVGAEVAFNSQWSGRIEYRATEMDQERFSFPGNGYDEGITPDIDTIRVGVSYHFQ